MATISVSDMRERNAVYTYIQNYEIVTRCDREVFRTLCIAVSLVCKIGRVHDALTSHDKA
jgi:hypothetical protein